MKNKLDKKQQILIVVILAIVLLGTGFVVLNQRTNPKQDTNSPPETTELETAPKEKEKTVVQDLIYTQDAKTNEVVVLDSDGMVITKIKVGGQPHDITKTGDNEFIFTGNISGSSVSIINPAKNKVVKTLKNIPGAHGVAVDKKGDRLYVTSTSTSKLYVFKIPTFELERTLETGGFPEYAIDVPANVKVFTTNLADSGSVTYVYKPTWFAHAEPKLGTNPFGFDPHGLALSPAGKTLAVTNLSSNAIYLIDAKGLGESYGEIRKVDTGATSEWAAFLSEKTLWVTNIGSDYISIIDVNRNKLIEEIMVGSEPHGVAFSKDKKSAFVSLMSSGEVVKINIASKKIIWKKKFGQELHNLLVL